MFLKKHCTFPLPSLKQENDIFVYCLSHPDETVLQYLRCSSWTSEEKMVGKNLQHQCSHLGSDNSAMGNLFMTWPLAATGNSTNRETSLTLTYGNQISIA